MSQTSRKRAQTRAGRARAGLFPSAQRADPAVFGAANARHGGRVAGNLPVPPPARFFGRSVTDSGSGPVVENVSDRRPALSEFSCWAVEPEAAIASSVACAFTRAASSALAILVASGSRPRRLYCLRRFLRVQKRYQGSSRVQTRCGRSSRRWDFPRTKLHSR